MPAKTLEVWSKGRGANAAVAELRVQKRGELAAQLEALAYRIIEAVTPEDITKASLRDKMICVGILIEKVLLLRGQPTQITRELKVREIYLELRQRFDLSAAEAKRVMIEKLAVSEAELGGLEDESKTEH